jgi:hypothetical protein
MQYTLTEGKEWQKVLDGIQEYQLPFRKRLKTAYTCNPRTWEAKTRGSWVQASLGYKSDPVSRFKKRKKKINFNIQYIYIKYYHLNIINILVLKYLKSGMFCDLGSSQFVNPMFQGLNIHMCLVTNVFNNQYTLVHEKDLCEISCLVLNNNTQ